MKKFLCATIVGLALLTLTACGGNDTIVYSEDGASELNTSPIDHDMARYLFDRLDELWDADDGYLWGRSLHAPFVIADTQTRYAVANMADVDGEIFTRQGNVYVGFIPETQPAYFTPWAENPEDVVTEVVDVGIFISNNNVNFGGQNWGVLTWNYVVDGWSDTESLLQTATHKTFHAIQSHILEGERPWGHNTHIDKLDNAISVRLELNALQYALRSTGDTRLTAVQDALSIRAKRQEANDGAQRSEAYLEILEGVTVYNDAMLNFDNLDDRLTFIENFIDSAVSAGGQLSSFGYYSGAMYALLLDEFGVNWRNNLAWEADLAAILIEALNFELIPFDEIELERYGYSEIRLFEEAWLIEIDRLAQVAAEALSGPLLLIYAMGEFNYFSDEAEIQSLTLHGTQINNASEFDYGDETITLLVHRDEQTVFYGNFTYTTHFGEVELTGGHLMLWRVMFRHGISAENMVIDGNRITTPTWTLTLNDGYELRELTGGHFAIGYTGENLQNT